MAGKFIVFEGLDMSGKSSQISILRSYLDIKHPCQKIIYTKEPGSDLNQIAPQIRQILLHSNENLSSYTEALLYAADRSHHVEALKKLIAEDVTVICDRYFYTSLAYQAYAGDLTTDQVLSINDLAIQGLVPDLYIHMSITLEEYLKRKGKRSSLDRIEQKDNLFFEKAIHGYEHMFEDMAKTPYACLIPQKQLKVDASKDMNTIANLIIKEVENIL